MSRKFVLAAAVVAAVAATAGFARAVDGAFDGLIRGCVKPGTGTIRASEDGSCSEVEQAVSWSDSAVFERYNQPPLGTFIALATWPAKTTIVTVPLPPGNYVISTHVDARKLDGGGLLVCTTYTAPDWASSILHTRLGTDAGETRRTTVAGTGSASLPHGGAAELKCSAKDWYGAAPMEVAIADVTAVRVGAVDVQATQ